MDKTIKRNSDQNSHLSSRSCSRVNQANMIDEWDDDNWAWFFRRRILAVWTYSDRLQHQISIQLCLGIFRASFLAKFIFHFSVFVFHILIYRYVLNLIHWRKCDASIVSPFSWILGAVRDFHRMCTEWIRRHATAATVWWSVGVVIVVVIIVL